MGGITFDNLNKRIYSLVSAVTVAAFISGCSGYTNKTMIKDNADLKYTETINVEDTETPVPSKTFTPTMSSGLS